MTEANGWKGEWLCTTRDLEKLEQYDLQKLVQQGCAWLIKDSRYNVKSALYELWTGVSPPPPRVFCREYVVFLQSGYWWRVPRVRIRLWYDYRGGPSKLKMSTTDFYQLWSSYYPGRGDRDVVVDGLEPAVGRYASPQS